MALLDRLLCLLFGSPRVRKLLVAFGLILILSWASESWDSDRLPSEPPAIAPGEFRKLSAENARLGSSVEQVAPKGIYIVVDTGKNRLYLKNGKKILLEAVCSTGNGKVLFDHEQKRRWEFNTPRGEFRVFKKVYRPVWTKPDWAFIEEGEQVPTYVSERFEEEMLGDYALHIGNGYLIHGTLYRRLLGRSVTHGCVRLGDEDLEKVYKAATVGTPVFIF